MGWLDGFKEGAKSLASQTISRGQRDIGGAIKDAVRGEIGQATNGILGDPRGAQQQDPSRPAARPTSAGPVGLEGVNARTQALINRYGTGGPQQAPGLMETLTSIPGRVADAILPSNQTVDRLKGGAAALGATADRIGTAGQEAVEAARKAVSKPTVEELNKRAENGEISHSDIQKMINAGQVQLPDVSTVQRQNPEISGVDAKGKPNGKPVEVVDRSTRAQPQLAETAPPAQPSLLEQGMSWFNSKMAAGATALAMVTAGPAAAITEPPPAAPPTTSAQSSVVVTPVPTSIAVGTPLAPASTVSSAPAVTTTVNPTAEFAEAAAPTATPAAPAAPAVAAPAVVQRFAEKDAGIYERAMAAVNAPKPGGMG